jgi:hypothetical protein
LASESKSANDDLADQMRQLSREVSRLNDAVEELRRFERHLVEPPPSPQR